MPFVADEFDICCCCCCCCLVTAGGGRLAVIFGDGEDCNEDTPFVWIPGGGGRLILGVGGGGTTAATTGAMVDVEPCALRSDQMTLNQ